MILEYSLNTTDQYIAEFQTLMKTELLNVIFCLIRLILAAFHKPLLHQNPVVGY